MTPTQQQLLASSNPRTNATWVAFFVDPFRVTFEWIGDGIAWLGGDRPIDRVEVALVREGFSPPEVSVPRGTMVVWRNLDSVAHLLTSSILGVESVMLEPMQSFSIHVPYRGTYYVESVREDTPSTVRGTIRVS
jgi:hypothetical protein